MANFPTSLDNSSSLPNPSAVNFTNNPSHAGLHGTENAAIIALETKLGITASTPSGSNLLVSTGTGTSTWSKIAPTGTILGTTDTQNVSNKAIASSTWSGGTIDNATITVDSIAGHTTSNTGSIYGVSVTAGVINSAALLNSVNTAAIQSSAIDYTKVASGFVVQVVSTNFTAQATGTTTVPIDNTIPQITEGTEFMTISITPKSATNILVISICAEYSYSIAANMIHALFQDVTANALAADISYGSSGGAPIVMILNHRMVAGTTSSTTFRVRAGSNSAGTITFNNALFGAITRSNITITEYKV